MATLGWKKLIIAPILGLIAGLVIAFVLSIFGLDLFEKTFVTAVGAIIVFFLWVVAQSMKK